MSRVTSPVSGKSYGLATVCRRFQRSFVRGLSDIVMPYDDISACLMVWSYDLDHRDGSGTPRLPAA